MKVKDNYDEREFQDLLDSAEENASGNWEKTFVSDLQDKFEEFGIGMFLSGKQEDILNRIANGE